MVVTVAGFWLASTTAPTFVSDGSFLVRRGGEDLAIEPYLGGGAAMDGAGAARRTGIAANAPHVLLSDALCRRVVRRLGVERVFGLDQPLVDAATGRRLDAQTLDDDDPLILDAMDSLRARLLLTMPKRTSLLIVEFEAEDARSARDVLDTYMDEAVRHHLEVYDDEAGIDLVEEGHERARTAHEAAVARYQAFLEEAEVTDFAAELEARRTKTQSTRDAVRSIAARTHTNTTLLKSLQERLESLDQFEQIEETVVEQNPRIAALEAQLREREAELIALRARYRPTDVAIRTAEKTIDQLRGSLASERQTPPRTITQVVTRSNPSWQLTDARIRDIQLDLALDTERRQRADRELTESESHLGVLTSRIDTHDRLSRAVEKSRTQLDQAEQALTLAQSKKLLNSKRVSSLTVLDRPSLPLRPITPSLGEVAFGALLLGVFLGIAIAFVLALTDRTVRTADDLERTLAHAGVDVPILAAIPRLEATQIRRHQALASPGCPR